MSKRIHKKDVKDDYFYNSFNNQTFSLLYLKVKHI